MSRVIGANAAHGPSQSAPISFNQHLLTAAGFTTDNSEIIACTPYVKGLGFSVKKRYPDFMSKHLLAHRLPSEAFGFISVSVYIPNVASLDRRAVAFVDVSSARQDNLDGNGLVTRMPPTAVTNPLQVSATFYFDPATFEGFIEGESRTKVKTLHETCGQLWNDHLVTTRRCAGIFVRLQLRVRNVFRKLPLIIVAILEVVVWALSGKAFQMSEVRAIENNNLGERGKTQLKSQWLFKILQRPANCSSSPLDRSWRGPVESKTTGVEIEFYGIKVSPVSGRAVPTTAP